MDIGWVKRNAEKLISKHGVDVIITSVAKYEQGYFNIRYDFNNSFEDRSHIAGQYATIEEVKSINNLKEM